MEDDCRTEDYRTNLRATLGDPRAFARGQSKELGARGRVVVLDLCAADPGPNAFGGIDQRLTCSFRQRACIDEGVNLINKRAKLVTCSVRTASIQGLDRGGQLAHQTVRLTLTQQVFRDQSSNVVHEEVNGILRSKRCAIDLKRTTRRR